MVYTEQEARQLVLEAGRRLVRQGLIARTWGNISARIEGGRCIITPSGRDYDTLQPEELAVVRLDDGRAAGPLRPSSETGMHTAVYRLRPDAAFLIHTHQMYASAVGVTGQDLPFAPCVPYAAPGSKRLWRAVADAAAAHGGRDAFLMANHGALLLGADCEAAFAAAGRLEADSEALFRRTVPAEACGGAVPLGSSVRSRGGFVLTLAGRTAEYPLGELPREAPYEAYLHAAAYEDRSVQCVVFEGDKQVTACGRAYRAVPAMLDDLAQIAGPNVRVCDGTPTQLRAALRRRNAVLLQQGGALCTGAAPEDAAAVAMILRKNCAALRYAAATEGRGRLSLPEAYRQRHFYVTRYARQRSEDPLRQKRAAGGKRLQRRGE